MNSKNLYIESNNTTKVEVIWMNIQQVTMYASNFEATKQFYLSHLGFPFSLEDENSFSFHVGKTIVTFRKALEGETPFYHFAFNVPSNQFEQAKAWAKSKVKLSTEEGDDEVYFENINAKSIYFEDPAGNIVEFICRLSDSTMSDVPFSASSLQKMSEMSLAIPNKLEAFSLLHAVGIFKRDDEELSPTGLTFMGEPEDATYLLLVNEGRTWYFSSKQAVSYPLSITLTNGITVSIDDDRQLLCTTKN